MITLLDLPLELLTGVCRHLNADDLLRVAKTCKRLRHGESGMETVELPSKSPVVAALRERAFADGELTPATRPSGCVESWVAYLAGCVPERRCREAPPVGADDEHTVFVGSTSQVLACGMGPAAGHGDAEPYVYPTPVPALAGILVRSVAAGWYHSLALVLVWDGRVYSWGYNKYGQLGHGDQLDRSSPALVQRLETVRSMHAARTRSIALTQSGSVFCWGRPLHSGLPEGCLLPTIVDGFGGCDCAPRVCYRDWSLRHRPRRGTLCVGL
jgi:hypothetical protein